MTADEQGHRAPAALPERYADPERIAFGGMGEVHRAFDRVLERPVAVKLLAPALAEDDEARRRFSREALAAARLSGHPHVVTIYDVGEWQGRPYLVMEYLSGGTLAERMRSGPVPRAVALNWLEQTAAALDAAHRAGLVHRDVKPANLLFDERGQLKVADFGIARVTGGDAATITGTGAMVGSVGYMAPEQLRGERVGPPADVYSLGAVAYELLTGDRPFGSRSTAAEMSAHLTETPPPASVRGPELSARVDPVLARALAKEPSERPPSARELVDDLAAALRPAPSVHDGVTQVHPLLAPPPPPPRRGGRRALVAGAITAAVLAAGAVAAVVGMGGGDGSGARSAGESSAGVVTRTRTVQRPPEVRTVTTPVPAPPPPATTAAATTAPPATTATSAPASPPPADAPSIGEARRLTDESYALILDGRLQEALPLAESALAGLDGTGDPYEGNALNNMGVILTGLGRCAEAEGFLARAQGTGSETQNRERVANLRRARECAPSASRRADASESLPSVAQARADTERAYVLIQNGREEEGLALQLPALRALEGTGDPYGGNAAYNVGLAHVQLGRCAEAVPYLEQSQGSGNASQNAIRRDMLARARACD